MSRGTACILLHDSSPILQSVLLLCFQKGIEGYAQAVYLNMARMGDMNFPDFFYGETRRIPGTGCSWSDWIRRSGEVAVVKLAPPGPASHGVFHRFMRVARPPVTVQQCRC